MKGHAGSVRPLPFNAASTMAGTFDARSAGISAHQRPEEDVDVPPQHAFGHARGAAGVEDVEVVGRAGAEVAVGGCARERRFVVVALARAMATTGTSSRMAASVSAKSTRGRPP